MCLRATVKYYVPLALTAAITTALCIYLLTKGAMNSVTTYAMLALVLGLGALAFLWLRAFSLEMDTRKVTYSTLLGGSQSIDLDAIAKVEWMLDYTSDGHVGHRPLRLELVPRPNSPAPRLAINARIFDRQKLTQLANSVQESVQNFDQALQR